MAEDSENALKGKRGPLKTLEDLGAWKICRELRSEITNLARSFPPHERFRLSDQVIRAARSAAAHLAEGYGRFHDAENVPFARQAGGSLYEVSDRLTVTRDEGFINDDQFNPVEKLVFALFRLSMGTSDI